MVSIFLGGVSQMWNQQGDIFRYIKIMGSKLELKGKLSCDLNHS